MHACYRFCIIISMHASRNKDACVRLPSQRCPQGPEAGAGTNIRQAFTTRKHAREKGRKKRMHHLDQRKHSFVLVVDPEKCANNCQLIVASAQRFLRHACAAYLKNNINKQNAVCATYTQTLIGVFFIHGNAHRHACLTGGCNLFYFDGRYL